MVMLSVRHRIDGLEIQCFNQFFINWVRHRIDGLEKYWYKE